MTAAREAVVLPLLFLSVLLVGGLRPGESAVLAAPSPYVLVLGVLLVRVVVQSGALAPAQLLSSSRSELANLNGLVVLLTLWAAAAQTLAVLIPATGLPRLAFGVFFLVLLLNTAASAPDRPRLLRSLAVTFGAAFVLKFVVLLELSAPGEGAVERALRAAFDGVTIGVLLQPGTHPAAPYLALFAVVLFLTAVFLLPHHAAGPRQALVRGTRTLPAGE